MLFAENLLDKSKRQFLVDNLRTEIFKNIEVKQAQ